MRIQSLSRVAPCFLLLGPATIGCSGSTEQPNGPSIGGAVSLAGGNTAAPTGQGGKSASGGGSAVGGASAAGGMVIASGGRTGDSVGGATQGIGGNTRGGAWTSSGGKASSGGSVAVGGKATGGSVNAGGAPPNTGGKAAGGATSVGGKAAGVGGKAASGASSVGGSASGGQTTGGSGGSDVVKSPGCGKTTALKGESTRTINVNGTNRSYIIRLPDNYDANHAYRMILSIHCLNGTAAGVASGSPGANYQYYGLWKLAGGSTIFVAPQGINNSWPSGNVPFLKALITDLENTLCIDTSRVFAEGFSMGGSMSYALACEIPDMIRGIAVHSGGPMSGCNRTNKPVAYFMTHGTKDGVCTYPGYGVPQINDFAKLNGCQAMDIPNTLKPTDTSGRTPACGDYQGCSAGYPTRACIFVGDHTPSPGGEATSWVPAETWKFITQF